MTMAVYPNGSDEPWTLQYFEETWDLDPMKRVACAQSEERWSGCTIVTAKWIAVDNLSGKTLWHEILHARGLSHADMEALGK